MKGNSFGHLHYYNNVNNSIFVFNLLYLCSQALNPHIEKFEIPPETVDHILKTKGQLEKKHSVRIFVSKSETVSVMIHRL